MRGETSNPRCSIPEVFQTFDTNALHLLGHFAAAILIQRRDPTQAANRSLGRWLIWIKAKQMRLLQTF